MGKEIITTNIQNLLTQVYSTQKYYDKIAILTGEKFNVFSIMSMEKNEVYTHSAIIAELLNPNGSHGQGDVFLRLFIDIINNCIDETNCINNKIPHLNNCEVLKEHTIKEHTIKELIKNQPCGGRIDIYVTNEKQCIIIENKIGADSQPEQLLRYYNYAINKYKNDFWLIYLQKTKNNHTPKDLAYSCGIDKNYINSIETKNKTIKITYENEILFWLKECLKNTTNLPIIRETINQYIFLINKITNQSNNIIMSNELINTIAKNPDYVNAVKTLFDSLGPEYSNLKKELISNMIKILSKKANDGGLLFKYDIELDKKESQFHFYKENWKYGVFFEFSENNMGSIDVGIRLIDNPTPDKQDNDFNNKVREKFGYQLEYISEFWVGWEKFIEWNDIQWSEFTDDTAANIVFDKVIKMINTLESIPELKLYI